MGKTGEWTEPWKKNEKRCCIQPENAYDAFVPRQFRPGRTMESKMANFTFAPSAKKLGITNPQAATIEFTFDSATGAVTLDGKPLPVASVEYLITYGAKQSLADSYASATTQAEFDTMLYKRIKKIQDGTMAMREPAATIDPFEAECIKISKARLALLARKQEKKLPKVASPEYAALLEKVRNGKGKAEIEALARKNLAAQAKLLESLSDDDIDFGGVEAAE